MLNVDATDPIDGGVNNLPYISDLLLGIALVLTFIVCFYSLSFLHVRRETNQKTYYLAKYVFHMF